jgi:hypothetical protein
MPTQPLKPVPDARFVSQQAGNPSVHPAWLNPYRSAATMSANIHISKERFDDVTPENVYRGFNYAIKIGDTVFKVRNYDDMPGWFTVISPTFAIKSPMARQLVDCLLSEFGCREVDFYDAETDSYREVDLQTLEFQSFEF